MRYVVIQLVVLLMATAMLIYAVDVCPWAYSLGK